MIGFKDDSKIFTLEQNQAVTPFTKIWNKIGHPDWRRGNLSLILNLLDTQKERAR